MLIDKEKAYKPKEICDLLNVPSSTLKYWFQRGWLKREKRANGFIVPGTELKNFLDWKLSNNDPPKDIHQSPKVEYPQEEKSQGKVEPVKIEPMKTNDEFQIPQYDFENIFKNWNLIMIELEKGKIKESAICKLLKLGIGYRKIDEKYLYNIGKLNLQQIQNILDNHSHSKIGEKQRIYFYHEMGNYLKKDDIFDF